MKLNNVVYPNSAKELRHLYYNASHKTWQKWLKELDLPLHIKIYTPEQIKKIVAHLGEI